MPYREALELRQQEGEQRGLTSAGHADDAGMPQVPDVGARTTAGVSTVDRNSVTASPQWWPAWVPAGEGVERAHGREVQRGNRCLARAVLGVSGQGRVDLPFQGHVLAHDDVAGVGQGGMAEGDVARQGVQVPRRRRSGPRCGPPTTNRLEINWSMASSRAATWDTAASPARDQAPALSREQVLGLVLVEEGEGLHPIQLVGLFHEPA
jgi:hypothetical protein